MSLNTEAPIKAIREILHMRWEGGCFEIAPRPYAALAFRIRGEATVRTGGVIYRVQENEILYLPEGVGYSAEYTDTEILVAHFHVGECGDAPQVFAPRDADRLLRLFAEAERVWQGKGAGYLPAAFSSLYAILAALAEDAAAADMPPYFARAVRLLHEELKNGEMTVANICRRAGIGCTAFRTLMKRYYGKTPSVYITDRRLAHARALIAEGMSVEGAALAAGFNDPKYFARVVRKRLGCTPRALREKQ